MDPSRLVHGRGRELQGERRERGCRAEREGGRGAILRLMGLQLMTRVWRGAV